MAYDKFPLKNLLKGKLLRIAELQDKLAIELASKFEFVLHGGTALWRVYGGRRVSLDIDIYHEKPKEVMEHFSKSGAFEMLCGKMTGSDVLYMKFRGEGDTVVELHVSQPFGRLEAADGEFRLVDGSSIILKTLTSEWLLKEKISAFQNRKKARDLYDIFYLLDIADASRFRGEIGGMLPLQKPQDFSGLRELILLGKAPEFETIERKLRAYGSK